MEKEILISIIIPHFNTPFSLMRLLDSIDLNENIIQVIVVDDNSNVELDQLARCRRYYQEIGVEFYINNGKKGAGTCRNIGLMHAKGKWILFADADDFFLPKFKSVILKYVNSNADIIFFNFTSIEEDTGNESVRHLAIKKYICNFKDNPQGKKENIELKYHHVGPVSKLIRHSVIIQNSIQFDEVLYSNDMMFSTKVAYYSHSIDASLESIYCCTRSGKSLTADISSNTYKIRREVWIRRYVFLKEHLSKEDFEILNLSGATYILTGISNKISIVLLLNTVIIFKKYHIKLVPKNLFKRNYIREHVVSYICEWRGSRKYCHGDKKQR